MSLSAEIRSRRDSSPGESESREERETEEEVREEAVEA
jgi:hypothetical protein